MNSSMQTLYQVTWYHAIAYSYEKFGCLACHLARQSARHVGSLHGADAINSNMHSYDWTLGRFRANCQDTAALDHTLDQTHIKDITRFRACCAELSFSSVITFFL